MHVREICTRLSSAPLPPRSPYISYSRQVTLLTRGSQARLLCVCVSVCVCFLPEVGYRSARVIGAPAFTHRRPSLPTYHTSPELRSQIAAGPKKTAKTNPPKPAKSQRPRNHKIRISRPPDIISLNPPKFPMPSQHLRRGLPSTLPPFFFFFLSPFFPPAIPRRADERPNFTSHIEQRKTKKTKTTHTFEWVRLWGFFDMEKEKKKKAGLQTADR